MASTPTRADRRAFPRLPDKEITNSAPAEFGEIGLAGIAPPSRTRPPREPAFACANCREDREFVGVESFPFQEPDAYVQRTFISSGTLGLH